VFVSRGISHTAANTSDLGRLTTTHDALDVVVQIGGACGFRHIVCETRPVTVNHEVLHRLQSSNGPEHDESWQFEHLD
jgi:hypothetical protein